MNPLRIVVVGAAGRMGQAIVAAAEAQDDFESAAQVDLGDRLEDALAACEVVIDFSHAEATEASCAACVSAQKPLVIGTTGHSAEQRRAISEAAKSVPVLLAANFSVGVNTLFWLTRKAAELLGDDFDVEILETHHRLKKDAPSGTAKRLAQVICETRGFDQKDIVHGR